MTRYTALALWGVAIALHHQAHGWSRASWGAMCVYWGIDYVWKNAGRS